MRNFFEPNAPQELESRIAKLTPHDKARWGKMNAAQMLGHCAAPMRVAVGELQLEKHPLRFLGSLLKKRLLSEKPFSKNSPTAKEFVRNQDCNFDLEREKFLSVFHRIAQGPAAITCFNHPFFGKMTADDWGRLIYKHLDHHLQQFGV